MNKIEKYRARMIVSERDPGYVKAAADILEEIMKT